jgi:hypothetical protein
MSGFGGFGGFGQNNNPQQTTGFGGFGSSTGTGTGRSYSLSYPPSVAPGVSLALANLEHQGESTAYTNLPSRHRLWFHGHYWRFWKHEYNRWWTLRWWWIDWRLRRLWRYVDYAFTPWIFLLDSISHGCVSDPSCQGRSVPQLSSLMWCLSIVYQILGTASHRPIVHQQKPAKNSDSKGMTR